jgi:signal-transduction protein with cAMP-binding, CBS, and nucleotidyltransferase domain
MSLDELIHRFPETLPPEATCTAAARLMREANVGAVVVADGTKPLGLVTDRDLAVRVVAEGRDPQQVRIREVMSGDPIFLSERRGPGSVIAVMRDLAIRRVMVVDDAGDLVGVVALDDLLMRTAEDLAGLAETIRKEVAPPRA